MKKRTKHILLLFFLVSILSTCSVFKNTTWIPLNNEKINVNEKVRTLTTLYSRSYFQVRYMSYAAIASNFIAPMPYMDLKTKIDLNNDLNSIEENNRRKKSNDFEKKLGDFSILSYFNKTLSEKQNSIKYFNIDMNFDKIEHDKIIKRIITYDKEKLDNSYTEELNKLNCKYVSAFKIQYGMGARAGGEQFGMVKSYRPYIRLVGLIKDISSNEFVWGNKIIVFSEMVYHGRDHANEALPDDLIEQFKDISIRLAEILIDDLNGLRYTSNEQLVDANFDDDLF